MALKTCKDCGKEVSTQAGKCPHCGAPVQAGGVFAMAILIAIFFVLIMIGVAFKEPAPVSSQSSPKATTVRQDNVVRKKISTRKEMQKKEEMPSLEHQLATVNAGGFVADDNISISRFRSLLKQLSSSYVENKQQIADMSISAQNILKKDGIQESLLNIMEGMNQVLPTKIENQKYGEYIAAYVTLRHKGQSHTDAVLGLQSILRQITKQG